MKIFAERLRELRSDKGLSMKQLSKALNTTDAAISNWGNNINEPKSLQEAGIDEKEFLSKIDDLADKAFEDQCTSANPRVPLIPEIKQIMLDAYYGKEI